MKLTQVAAQLYTVPRPTAKPRPRLAVALEEDHRAIGYGAVQVSGVGTDPPSRRSSPSPTARGLVICATHEPGKDHRRGSRRAVIDRLGRLGCAYTAYPYPAHAAEHPRRGAGGGQRRSTRARRQACAAPAWC